jgi:hypothetical protein
MNEKFITLPKSNVLRLGIKDENGIETGEFLEFDLEDIELPLKYQELYEKEKKNREFLRNQVLIIEKKQDSKTKGIYTKNELEKIKVVNDFFKKEAEIYNMFLGKNGVQKLLNGRKLGWTSLQEIDEIIEKQIAPYIDVTMDDISKKVKEKYNEAVKRNNTLKLEEDNE